MPTSTHKDLNAYIGKTGQVDLDGLTVQVKVTDARVRFGHTDLLLTPVAGTGSRWTCADRVRLRTVRRAGTARTTKTARTAKTGRR